MIDKIIVGLKALGEGLKALIALLELMRIMFP